MTGSKSSWGVSKYTDSETGEEFDKYIKFIKNKTN